MANRTMAFAQVWKPLVYHPASSSYSSCKARFTIVHAGRRSGKTARAKRRLVLRAMRAHETQPWPDPRYFFGAPTRDQAKRIYWADLKAMIPRAAMIGEPRETDLSIRLANGAEVCVIGFDKPARMEGLPWDGGVLDEYADMKQETWTQHIRAALMDRAGWCDFIGVPEGRNHYYHLAREAHAQVAQHGPTSDWAVFGWGSAEVLPLYGRGAEVEAARRDMDERTFQQELGGEFVSFEGRAYYQFDDAVHCAALPYDPNALLVLCFDFNVSPGVACVCQEMILPGKFGPNGAPAIGTGVIGEVFIEHNSNTPAVCRRLLKDWGAHAGPVHCYGDATGGSKHSSQTEGSDWELIRQALREQFHERVGFRYGSHNPPERARVNAVNSRLKAADGTVRLMVDPAKAPQMILDFEGVQTLKGGSGELDKHHDPARSHLSDGLGYYIAARFPVRADTSTETFSLAGRIP